MKPNIILLIMSSVLIAIFLIISSAFSPEFEKKIKDGKVVYKKNCVACHMKNGKGVPHTFPPLVKSDYLINNSKEHIIKLILEGQKGKIVVNGKKYNNVMLPLKKLSDYEIAAVLTYINNNFGNSGPEYFSEEIKKQR